ncbi:Hydrocephalus-inducing [Lonchura striata]|uniref:Hydrocephalus-inducing n=1 Tax=Lonchura striata TaxID=40157 RepID=A0A218UAL3_9PASE|nr:Hydrocephalus-inducing [Lonchura striata domestica]
MASGFPKKTPAPRLLRRERLKPDTLTPSAFQKEMSLSTKQLLARAKKHLPKVELNFESLGHKIASLVLGILMAITFAQLCHPFSVLPATGALAVGDAVQVTVGFQPLKTGDCSASLVVHYDTGEDTHTSLHGRAVDAHIRLDQYTVSFEKTYVSLSNHTAVRIHNMSDITVCFQWKAVDSGQEEDQLELR